MDSSLRTDSDGAQAPASLGAGGGPPSERPATTTVLLLSIWIGLIAGFLDLGFVWLKKHLGDDFYRLSDGFPWLIPSGVAALVALTGLALVAVAGLRRRRVPLGLAIGLPSFVGFLDLCAQLPLAFWSSLLLSIGLAIQSARLGVRRRSGFLRLVRRTSPLLVGTVLAARGGDFGGPYLVGASCGVRAAAPAPRRP